MGDGASQLDDPTGARRELRHERIAVSAEVHQLQQLVDRIRDIRLRLRHSTYAEHIGHGLAYVEMALERRCQDFGHRHRREQPRVLEGAAEPAAGACCRRQLSHVDTVEQHLAAVGRDEPRAHVEQRRLSRAVRPDDSQDPAVHDVYVDVIHRAQAAKGNAKPPCLQPRSSILRRRTPRHRRSHASVRT